MEPMTSLYPLKNEQQHPAKNVNRTNCGININTSGNLRSQLLSLLPSLLPSITPPLSNCSGSVLFWHDGLGKRSGGRNLTVLFFFFPVWKVLFLLSPHTTIILLPLLQLLQILFGRIKTLKSSFSLGFQ